MSSNLAHLAPENDATPRTIAVGAEPLSVEDVLALGRSLALPTLPDAARERMEASAAVLRRHLSEDRTIYGVTTGVGASVDTDVAAQSSQELSLNVMRMHGCGTGRFLTEEESGTVLAVRLASLARGYSGVRPVVADALVDLLAHRLLPRIPAEGSVGASGDLTPLSYVAAVLVGEREVMRDGEVVPAAEALADAGLEPLELGPKEALALMNGTAVCTALGCLAWERARRVARWSSALTAMASEAVRGNPAHFDPGIHEAKPHPGQVAVARWIRQDLGDFAASAEEPARLQDRYSIRCAPHVVGVLVDALTTSRRTLETELNGVDDNPIVDPDRGVVLHGGNFYGGHVGHTLDGLKAAVASVADMLDRQLMLLCSPTENGGLPSNLVGVTDEEAPTHHGFKAVTIGASALAAEALKLTMPASAFSRSTELHNQDKVPMASIAAREALRSVELTEQVAAMVTLACCQALDLRHGKGSHARAMALHHAVREVVPPLDADRRMDHDLQSVLRLARTGALPVGDEALPGEEATAS